MSNIAFLFLPLAFSSLPAVLPFVSPSSQVIVIVLRFSLKWLTKYAASEEAQGVPDNFLHVRAKRRGGQALSSSS